MELLKNIYLKHLNRVDIDLYKSHIGYKIKNVGYILYSISES